MTIRFTPKSYKAAQRVKPPRLSASEEGLFKPITAKVSNALSDEYVEQIKAQARTDAAKGRYMDGYDSQPRTGFSAMRDAQMKELVSPDRDRAIAQVTAALKSRKHRPEPGSDPLLLLMGIPCTAKVFHGPVNGRLAQIYNEDGEMIAGYREAEGWITVPTMDETRFQYESTQIYHAAYNETRAEIENAAQRTEAPALKVGTPAGFDARA